MDGDMYVYSWETEQDCFKLKANLGYKLQACLGYSVRPCLKTKETKHKH